MNHTCIVSNERRFSCNIVRIPLTSWKLFSWQQIENTCVKLSVLSFIYPRNTLSRQNHFLCLKQKKNEFVLLKKKKKENETEIYIKLLNLY